MDKKVIKTEEEHNLSGKEYFEEFGKEDNIISVKIICYKTAGKYYASEEDIIIENDTSKGVIHFSKEEVMELAKSVVKNPLGFHVSIEAQSFSNEGLYSFFSYLYLSKEEEPNSF